MKKIGLLLLLLLQFGWLSAQDFSKMTKKEGFVPFYLDEEKGKIYLEINSLNQELLYVNTLTSGIGSNDIGLDRGQLGETRVIEFRKAGNKILMVHKNYDYRAYTKNAYEAKSIQDAFLQMYTFENTCRIQVDALSGQTSPATLTAVNPQILNGVAHAMKVQTGGLGGSFVWPSLLRKLNRENPGYDV